MTNPEHQLDEMVNAIQQVIAVSEHKSRLTTQQEVIKLINDGLDKNHSPFTILSNLTNWAGGK